METIKILLDLLIIVFDIAIIVLILRRWKQ